jgi:hypothetical protein
MRRKNISTKIQVRTFVLLALIWVAGFSVLFILGHCIAAIGVILFPFALEYSARCVKAGKVIIPHREKMPVKTPEIAPNLITSISVLTVYQFTRCYAYDDLTILGTGSHKQIKDCWNDLLSQYHAAVKNDNLLAYIKLMRRKSVIEIRKTTADKFCTMLKEAYSPTLASSLRQIFKEYKLTIDSVHKDLKHLQTALIAEKIERDRIIKELAEMDKSGSKATTPEEKEADIVDMLIEIRKHEQTNYNAKEMTVLEFARCQNRLTAHYERLKQQTNDGR